MSTGIHGSGRPVRTPGVTLDVAAPAGLHDALDQIITQLRAILDPSGVAFEVIDSERRWIRPEASWFVTHAAREAFEPLMRRSYDPARPGITEAAVEAGAALLIERVEDWAGAERLRERLADGLGAERAATTWAWYRNASFMACPVRTAAGSTLGVLVISTHPPAPPLRRKDLRTVEAFASLAALALERSQLLDAEARRTREEKLLNAAWHAVAASLDLDVVYRAIVAQARALTDADRIVLARFDLAAEELRGVASHGLAGPAGRVRFRLGEGMAGRGAQTGVPAVSCASDAGWVIEGEPAGSSLHVPIVLAGRLFGVLSAAHAERGRLGDDDLRRLVELARGAAGAIANALDFQRERRTVDAMTRGFVPGPPDALPGLELGLVYEPVGHQVGGGDLFGVWTLPGGAVAVLLGDVSGKGLEVAALSAMVRFFVEARAWDTDDPAEVLAQTNRILRGRLPPGGFVTAFLAVVEGPALRYCNAGHPPPLVLRADGGEDELAGTGLPLGVQDDGVHTAREVAFEPGDTLFAATDGLGEARREGAFFSDARLPELLARHGRTMPPQALAEMLHAEAERWAPRLHDDVVVLLLRRNRSGAPGAAGVELRREAAGGRAGTALFAEYMALVGKRVGPGVARQEAIFATDRAFEAPGAVFLVLYEDGVPVGCGGMRPLEPGVAEIKRMFVTARARGRGHGRRLLVELERLAAAAGARRVRLLTTEVLAEARALYAAAGYREVEAVMVDGRRDAWLERPL